MLMAKVIPFCFSLLTLAMALALGRLVRGPCLPDRALALDTVYVIGMAMLVLMGITKQATYYFDIALLIAVLSYISTVAVAKYMLRGDIIEQ